MSQETDRITVPTNGHKPPRVADPPIATTGTDADATARNPIAKVISPELTIAVTPAQLAVGFGVIAGIVLLLLGRRRGRRKA